MPDTQTCDNHACDLADNCWTYGKPPDLSVKPITYQPFVPIEGGDLTCQMFKNYPNYNELSTNSDIFTKEKEVKNERN